MILQWNGRYSKVGGKGFPLLRTSAKMLAWRTRSSCRVDSAGDRWRAGVARFPATLRCHWRRSVEASDGASGVGHCGAGLAAYLVKNSGHGTVVEQNEVTIVISLDLTCTRWDEPLRNTGAIALRKVVPGRRVTTAHENASIRSEAQVRSCSCCSRRARIRHPKQLSVGTVELDRCPLVNE